MKKVYTKPSVESIKIQMESIIALSTQEGEITGDNKDDFEPLSREDNPSRPNLWEQGW